MKINVFLQARMSSTRLPGKVLMELCGKPMIGHQIERIRLSKCIDKIVILTSTDSSDDELAKYCESINCKVFRGNLNNVLSRFIGALKKYPCDHVVRLTGDCPLIDWNVVDLVVGEHINNGCDYTSNTLTPTFPDGLDVEVFTKDCLNRMFNKATTQLEKEHVTYYCYTHKEEFSLHNVVNDKDQSAFRWTVDSIEDFNFVEQIYNSLYPTKHLFSSEDISKFLLENPNIMDINHHTSRNEALTNSIGDLK